MKLHFKTITIFTFIIITKMSAQKVDWVNAPLNPIAFKYKLEHFNLKGDVYAYDDYLFSKNGLLYYENTIVTNQFLYNNNKLYADTSGRLYEINSQGYVSKMTYASLGVHSMNYSYNTKGLLTKTANSKGFVTTYEYDEKNRLQKCVSGESIKEYRYETNGEHLIVTEIDYSKSPTLNTKKVYKNGHLVGQNAIMYDMKFDKLGNIIPNYSAPPIYYNGIENRKNEISMVWTKPYSMSYMPINDCKFYINGTQVDFIFKQVIDKKSVMVYDPFQKKYYIVEDAFNESKSKIKQVFSKVFIDSNSYLEMLSGTSPALVHEGNRIGNALYLRPDYLKLYSQFDYHIAYEKLLDKTFFCKFNPNEKSQFFPLQQISPNDNIFFIKEGNVASTVEKGTLLDNNLHTIAYNGNDAVLFKNNVPLYYLPNYKNAQNKILYPGRLYNKTTDTYQLSSNANTATNTTNLTASSTTSNCISGNCTDGFGELKTLKSTITGFFKDGKANGYGKEVYSDGSGFYQGTFKDGFRDGFGYYEWKSSQQNYIGLWKSGFQHGYGYYSKSGTVFQAGYYENGKQTRNMLTQGFIDKQVVGNCIGDCVNGFGSYKFQNNDMYHGFFVNGKKSYVGAYTWASGNVYVGEYINDVNTGDGEEYYSSIGTTYRGSFVNRKREGIGVYFNKANTVESKGFWENGELKTSY